MAVTIDLLETNYVWSFFFINHSFFLQTMSLAEGDEAGGSGIFRILYFYTYLVLISTDYLIAFWPKCLFNEIAEGHPKGSHGHGHGHPHGPPPIGDDGKPMPPPDAE